MSFSINNFSEDIILEVIIAYLYENKSHRTIQRDILGIPAPARGGGFVAMNILHHFEIYKEKKGILLNQSIDEELSNSTNKYNEILKKIKEYKNIEKCVNQNIKINSVNLNHYIQNGTELNAKTKIRIHQKLLRKHILKIYNNQCALCEIDKPDLLICSHIKPWSVDELNRLNLSNAICLCALHDKLFDKGYFSFNENYEIIFGNKADLHIKNLLKNVKFKKPSEYPPDLSFLKFHYEKICK